MQPNIGDLGVGELVRYVRLLSIEHDYIFQFATIRETNVYSLVTHAGLGLSGKTLDESSVECDSHDLLVRNLDWTGDGWPATKEGTDRTVNQGWRVILYDVRGMGYSDRNVADVELAHPVLDVEAVVAALNLDRFALAGVDIGAATAVAYLIELPTAPTA